MEPLLNTKPSRYFQVAGIALIIAIPVLGLAGLGKYIDSSLQSKTLWDWMNLLLVPLFLAGGFVFLSRSQRTDEEPRNIEDEADVAREIAVDHQQAAALQAYIDRMSELLLKDKLSKFSSDEVRNVAKSRTLAVLRELDAQRKGSVLLFLKDSGLIDREAVIDLCGADLRSAVVEHANLSRLNLAGADLSGADLHGANLGKSFLSEANLSGANLSGANLSGAELFESNLSGANLNQAKLNKANFNGADLRGVRLNEADLCDADLSGANLNVGDLVGANLRGAKLGGAKLLGADLREADLSQADLSGTQITDTALEKAKSLAGTTMPDGTKHL
ncbi:MAG TPA: pentapeptide repeat-containing protein [Anaerolineales bacterium]|nr:pentapeptide repeat-containing protein [Anaerolineales bacterium]